MADTFQYRQALDSTIPADRWYQITPDDDADLPIIPRSVLCTSDGNLVAIDAAGTSMTVALVAGDTLPIRPARVGETSTGTFYALY